MPITITNAPESTSIIITVFLAAIFLGFRKTQHADLFPVAVTQELKGLGILAVVFSHIGYMLVKNPHFLYPLGSSAGVGVDLFLFMSGYGLTVGMLKKPLSATEFYKRRLIKVFIPFWIVLITFFVTDAVFLNISYSPTYMIQSILGWFPSARGFGDVNSPLWYITWLLLFYALFPLLFNAERPWQTALILAVIANAIAIINPLGLQSDWLHRIHTNGFSLGMILAWLLRESKEQPNPLAEKLRWFRNESTGFNRYIVIAVMTLIAGYMTLNSSAYKWPQLSSILDGLGLSDSSYIGQAASLITMVAVIIAFSLKKLDNSFLYLFGAYSYETYLVHWPLMSRYDVFFTIFPAWLAVVSWLLAFLAIGWLLQKITTPLGAWIDSKW